MMSLPASQRRALNRIEKALADDHPSLGPMFAIFTTLVDNEAMPVTERVTARAWRSRRQRRVWPAVATLVGLAMAAAALFTVSAMLPSPQVCSGTFTAAAEHPRPDPTGRLLACTTRQSKRAAP